MNDRPEIEFRGLWDHALPFDAFVAASTQHRGLWDGLYRTARLPEWALEPLPTGLHRRFLVLAEDWCGDASNTIPVLARLVDAVPGLELGILRRDENPELMDRYLTNGSRSIPIVIALDEDFSELGHWGPRPAELQQWVLAMRPIVPKAELYPQVRRWYARDRGESTLREVLVAAGLRGRGDGTAVRRNEGVAQ